MILVLYDLMGSNVYPPVNDDTKNQHVESVLKVNMC